MRHLLLPLLALACGSSAVGPVERPPEGGTWRLVAIDGEPVPFERPPVPGYRDPGPGCDLVFAAGRFGLDAGRRRYGYHYDIVSSCDGRLVDRVQSFGDYVPGPEGVLTAPLVFGPLPFAVIRADTVLRRTSDGLVAFADRTEPITSLVGVFPLRLDDGAGDEVDCGPVLSQATLHLQHDPASFPRTGSYAIHSHHEDRCSGERTENWELGTYDQVDRVLGFTVGTVIPPGRPHHFIGEIRDDEIVLRLGEGDEEMVFYQ